MTIAVGWPVTTPREFVRLVNCSSKLEVAADCCSSGQPPFQKRLLVGEIRNSRHTAMDEASETRELALELALDRASTADVSAAVSDWAQTATAKTGRKMEERMVNY